MAKAQQFKARQAPPQSDHEWWDDAGRHEARVGTDGVFKPRDAHEVAFADRQGWPTAKTRSAPKKQATPKKPAAKRAVVATPVTQPTESSEKES